MIELENLSKGLWGEMILKGISTRIERGTVCGLVGSNGAGKSTLLRCISGVYHPLEGEVRIAGKRVDITASAREKIFFLADDPYFPEGSNMQRMAKFYASYYPSFSQDTFVKLCDGLHLDPSKKVSRFSKGMRMQAAVILALATRTPYLLLDESFDGLDPVVRQAIRQLLCSEVAERKLTVIISSHSLRELQDLCDQLLFLHQGKLLLDRKTTELNSELLKVQTAFDTEYDRSIFDGLDIVRYEKLGKIASLIIRGSKEQIKKELSKKKPVLLDIMSLTLEEIFTCEAEALGYSFELTELTEDIKK